MPSHPHEPSTFHARIDTMGRLTIPAALRARHHMRIGDEVLIVQRAGALEIKTHEQVAREAQAMFRAAAASGPPMSEELIAERRAEAARDD